jgi:hypothetical protein
MRSRSTRTGPAFDSTALIGRLQEENRKQRIPMLHPALTPAPEGTSARARVQLDNALALMASAATMAEWEINKLNAERQRVGLPRLENITPFTNRAPGPLFKQISDAVMVAGRASAFERGNPTEPETFVMDQRVRVSTQDIDYVYWGFPEDVVYYGAIGTVTDTHSAENNVLGDIPEGQYEVEFNDYGAYILPAEYLEAAE